MSRPEVPDWVVKLLIGGAAVGGVIYVLHEAVSKAFPTDYWREQYEYWLSEYFRELKEFVEGSGGALTPEQQRILDEKRERIEAIEQKLMEVSGEPWERIVYPLMVAAGTAIILRFFPYEKVARALKYFRDNAPHAKSSHGTVVLLTNTLNACYAELGNVSLAVASQTYVNAWVNNSLYPLMHYEIAYLQSMLPHLTGVQYVIASYMISALQYQLTVGIPAMLYAVTQLIPLIPLI